MPVRVVAFCGARWTDGQWEPANFSGKPFDASHFEDWYHCPDAQLKPGEVHTDESNWTGGDALRASMTKWCYVGVTAQGHLVRGDSTVHHRARLVDAGSEANA